ncbi:DUF3696 domain-containing protein [bacterium]|nr:DUF3696 domain-containing protein [bacterium]
MIKTIELKHFKSWKDSGPVKLAPLTVFFGTNSSGKSSILQLLLMLKQTAQSPDRNRVLHTGDSNSLVDLGTYYDLIYNHDIENNLKFTLFWNYGKSFEIILPDKAEQLSGETLGIHSEISLTENLLTLEKSGYVLGSKNGLEFYFILERNEKSNSYEFRTEPKLKRTRGRPWPIKRANKFYGFPDEIETYYQNTEYLKDFELELERLLGSIQYVGPLREKPKKIYQWAGQEPEWVGIRGEKAIEALLASTHKNRRINLKPGGKYRSIEETVAFWLKEMGLIHGFRTRPIAEYRKEYDVLVRIQKNSPEVNLTDVGFGVSQVLPVIVESLYARENSVLLFEQPEIHLHPRVQSSLADMFIDALNAREKSNRSGGRKREIQLIVESHSEHFLNRLQRRIAEGRLSKDDTALYFCRSTREGSKIEPLELDQYGNIHNWPDNFFGDEMEDITARAEIEYKNRMAKS